ncbi:hypothetical protein H4R20_001774, partial [Coemansia guatemalensis]
MAYQCPSSEGWGSLNSTGPTDLTACFQHGVLSSGLNALFLVAAAVRMRGLSTKGSLPSALVVGRLFWAKLFFAAAALLESVVELLIAVQRFPYLCVYTLSLALQVAATATAVCLHHREQLRNRIASTPLLLFWLGLIILGLLRLRTIMTMDYSNGFNRFADLDLLYTAASFATFFLECQPKPLDLFKQTISDSSDDEFGKPEHSDNDYCTSGSPEERANVFSRYTYTWVGSLLEKGYRQQLQLSDVWKLSGQYRPDVVNKRFQESWQREMSMGNPSLFRATVRTYWSIWVLAAICELVRTITMFVRCEVFLWLIEFAAKYGTDQGQSIEYGYFYAVLLFVVDCVQNVSFRIRCTHAQRIRTLIRTSYMMAIYQKTLVLSSDARQKYDIGSIVTHMSIDSEAIVRYYYVLSQEVWSDPLRIFIALFMLYRLLSWSALVGLLLMIACMPAVSRIGRIIGERSKLLNGYRDQRMGIINEVLAGIKVVKLYAWESSFIRRINKVRVDLELEVIRKNNVLRAVLQSASSLLPFMVSFATFGAYSLFDNVSRGPLDARLVFVGMPLLSNVRASLRRLPLIIPDFHKMKASANRLNEFLTASEIDVAAVDRQPYNRDSADSDPSDVLVSVKDGSFAWSTTDEPALKGIDFLCKRSELVAIIGRVGSGKSSLVSAILGEMVKCSGDVSVRGSIAYVSQQPWILNATLRDNILFGSDYDQAFYNQVIEACALRPDIDMLPAGDMTEIGERGINLSGGQKMRVSLARAVYASADVYILDDPLAAVDAHVSKHIFTHVLGPQGILQSRARILTTNALQYLSCADSIIMLNKGAIAEQGSFAQAMDRKHIIFDYIHRHIGEFEAMTESSGIPLNSSSSNGGPDKADSGNTLTEQSPLHKSFSSSSTASSTRSARMIKSSPPEEASNAGKTTTAEFRRKGEVEWKTYRAYIKAGGAHNILTAIIAFIVAVAGEVATKLWLKQWTSSNTHDTHTNAPETSSALYYLSVYGALGLFVALANMLQLLFIWTRCSTKASTAVHQDMLTSVLRSPLLFFDTTPTGRILNRFSSDIQVCDETLPYDISMLSDALFNIILAVVVAAITTPLMLAVIPLLVIVGYHYQRLYIRSSREIRRLDSTTRSPIYAHYQESAGGVSIIRAYRHQSRFISEMEFRVGQYIRVDNTYVLLNQWLGMRLETIGNIVILGTALLSVAAIHYSGFGDTSRIGLAVGCTLVLGGTTSWGVRYYCNMEISMTHLERAAEYANLLPEAADIIEHNRPKESWPKQGMVEFRNYSMRYREGLDLALKDLSFRVLPRQKVGIVGRTGAGKSSLTLALFRIIEAASGQILLDGKDISEYGLFDVRSKLSIIPQDPLLFAGTVRENLDPFNNYSDRDIWRALEQAHLAEYIRSKDERLEFMVSQSGENFSVGQRQLICLARALLKHAKVLVLDEATAAIDNVTDEIIQQTIRSKFKDCTVLTIAHRLNTIIDSDMVLVVDNGHLAEYDTPQNLLASKGSLFSKLVEEMQHRNT